MKTVGERIRYFRKMRKITQDKLAELSGIHPVSIRKYETNKMQPQIEQTERIAAVLNINTSAIIGYNSKPPIVRTLGDLAGTMMMLFKAHVLVIVKLTSSDEENTDEDDFGLDEAVTPESTLLIVNPSLSSLFSVTQIVSDTSDEVAEGPLSLERLSFIMKNRAFAVDFLTWAAAYTLYERMMSLKEESSPDDSVFDIITEQLEELELSILSNTEPLMENAFDDGEPLFMRATKKG